MDYIQVDVFIKDILNYLKTDLRLYKYGKDKIKDQLETGRFTKDMLEHLLGLLVDKCKSCIDIYEMSPYNVEINNLIMLAKSELDKIPKWNGFKSYEQYHEGDYRDLDIDSIYTHIRACLRIDKILSEVVLINNLQTTAKKTVDSIDSINGQVELSAEMLKELADLKANIENTLLMPKMDKEALKRYIDLYNEYAQIIWTKYLDSNEDNNLVHNCSKGGFNLKDFDYSYSMSTSLITNKSAGLFKSAENNYYGFIIKPKRILAAEDRDVFAVNNSKGLDGRKFYNGDYASAIMLPWEIERKLVEKTVKANGQMLSYENENDKNMYANSFYSEVVLEEYEIIGVFFMSYGEGEMSLNYDEAYNMASINNLPLKEIDICSLRAKNNISVMTKAMEK
ncbi:MAG: hypothetical protein K2J20_00990, partial [Bacilli bacterium]|nr:hypothetical protein [Bacilli bacterium]